MDYFQGSIYVCPQYILQDSLRAVETKQRKNALSKLVPCRPIQDEASTAMITLGPYNVFYSQYTSKKVLNLAVFSLEKVSTRKVRFVV